VEVAKGEDPDGPFGLRVHHCGGKNDPRYGTFRVGEQQMFGLELSLLAGIIALCGAIMSSSTGFEPVGSELMFRCPRTEGERD